MSHFSEAVLPLTELTKKKFLETLICNSVHETAFQRLKHTLKEAPTIYTPVYGNPYIIQRDASQFDIGACISQEINGKIRPIYYAIQKLTPTQQSWSTIEKEAYAIMWTLKHFETLIFGANIEMYTDHNSLTFLTRNAPESSKKQRCALVLQKYSINIQYCPGAKMINADSL